MLVLPHIKKDLFKLKWLLLGYTFLVIVAAAMNIGSLRMSENLVLRLQLPMLGYMISFLAGLVSIVMIPLLIQEDALVGTTAFWFTRPIARRDLLIAKMTFLVLFIVLLPLVAELLVMTINHIPAHYLWLAAPEIIIKNIGAIVPVLILAALTVRFSHFAMIGIGIVAGVGVLSILFTLLISFGGLTSIVYNAWAVRDYSLQLSKELVSSLLMITGGLTLVVHQYLTRKTARTISWAVAGFIVLQVMQFFWRIDLLESTTTKISTALPGTQTMKSSLDMDHIAISDNYRLSNKDPLTKTIRSPLTEAGTPSGMVAVLTELTAPYIILSDSETLISLSVSPNYSHTLAEEKFMTAFSKALPGMNLIAPFESAPSFKDIFTIKGTEWDKYKGRQGTYLANAKYDIYEFKKSFSLPLTRGTSEARGAELIEIFDIVETPNGVSIILTEKKANLLFDRDTKKENPATSALDQYNQPFMKNYVLINPQLEEVYLPALPDENNIAFEPIQRSLSLNSRTIIAAKRLDFNSTQNSSKIDKAWLSGASLVRVDAVLIGKKKLLIRQEDFKIPEKSTVNLEADTKLD